MQKRSSPGLRVVVEHCTQRDLRNTSPSCVRLLTNCEAAGSSDVCTSCSRRRVATSSPPGKCWSTARVLYVNHVALRADPITPLSLDRGFLRDNEGSVKLRRLCLTCDAGGQPVPLVVAAGPLTGERLAAASTAPCGPSRGGPAPAGAAASLRRLLGPDRTYGFSEFSWFARSQGSELLMPCRRSP
ncbi:unnamed protein product [Gadus morhua 'NCC']